MRSPSSDPGQGDVRVVASAFNFAVRDARTEQGDEHHHRYRYVKPASGEHMAALVHGNHCHEAHGLYP